MDSGDIGTARLSPFQQSALQVPETCNLALLGAREGAERQRRRSI